MTLLPADADTGIVFNVSTPENPYNSVDIPANLGSVCATDLCTVLGKLDGLHVATIEHLMAAAWAPLSDPSTVHKSVAPTDPR